MKTILIIVLFVCLLASLNTTHVIVETYDEDFDDDANITEDGEEIGNILAFVISISILIPFL